MPKAISEDLRKRALRAYRCGKAASVVAADFAVCERSIYRWDKQEKATGSLASGHARSGRKSKIVIDKRFEEFAQATAHQTLQQMAEHWQQLAADHEQVSRMAMCRAVKKLGWTRKKRRTATKSATKEPGRGS